jgi:hypothetical protein
VKTKRLFYEKTTNLGKKIIFDSVKLQSQEKIILPQTDTILFYKINNADPAAIFAKTGIIINESNSSI